MESVANKNIKIKNFLESNYTLLIISLLIALSWMLDFIYIAVATFMVFQVLIFIFCKDNPKPTTLLILAIPYMITSLYGTINWILYAVSLSLFVLYVAFYSIRKIVKEKYQVTKGVFFYPFLLMLLGNALAGVIGHFEIVPFLITILLTVLSYGIYWFFINFIKDDKRYFSWVLVFLSVIICLELLYSYSKIVIETGNFEIMFSLDTKVHVGIGEINSAAVFLISGIISAFYLGLGQKRDYLYLLLAIVFDIFMFFTKSRICLLVAVIASIIYFVLMVKNSKRKRNLFFVVGAFALILVVFCAIKFDFVKKLLSAFTSLGFGLHGRGELWPWCWQEFLNNKIFGAGFVTHDKAALTIPGISTNLGVEGMGIINAHNTILHYLTCTGIVGLILNIPFFIVKYKVLFKKFSQYKFFLIMNIVMIAITSLVDCTQTMSFFNIILIYLILGLAENDNKNGEVIENLSKRENKKEEEKPSSNIQKGSATRFETVCQVVKQGFGSTKVSLWHTSRST